MVVDKKTKNLVRRIRPGEIGIICHRDLDELGALSLIEARVKAVINVERSISGRYPNLGPALLYREGIPLIDNVGTKILEIVKDGDTVEVKDGRIYRHGTLVGRGCVMNEKTIKKEMDLAKRNLEAELDGFIDNTLEYAKKEKDFILGKLVLPKLNNDISGRHALVIRGKDYRNDLA